MLEATTSKPGRFAAAFARVDPVLRKALQDALLASARDVAREAKGLIRQGEGGERKGLRKRARLALRAAGGQPPVSRSGRLARSIRARRARRQVAADVIAVATNARGQPYPRWVEYGYTRASAMGGGQVPAYPFLNPARDRLADKTYGRVVDAIGEAGAFLDRYGFA